MPFNSKKCKLMLMEKKSELLAATKGAKAVIIVNCGILKKV